MPVVLAAGSSGILLHEAIGHGMEADFNRKGTSIYADKINKAIAAPFVSIVDDGTQPHARGAVNVDDEGNEAQKTVLVDKGVLATYLHDRISAQHYKVKPTGSGRRESIRCAQPGQAVTRGDILGICSQGSEVFSQGGCPTPLGFIHEAEVRTDLGMPLVQLRRALLRGDRLGAPATLEQGPAECVPIGSLSRLQFHRPPRHFRRFRVADVEAVDIRPGERIQDAGVGRTLLEEILENL